MDKLKQLLPSAPEVLLYAVLSVIVLIVGNLSSISAGLGLTQEKSDFTVLVTQNFRSVLTKLDNFAFTSTAVTYLLYFVSGLLLINIVVRIYAAISEVKEDFNISTTFVHPRNFSQKQFWKEVITKFLSQIAALAGLGVWGGLFLLYLLPLGTKVGAIYLRNVAVFSNIIFAVISLLILFIGISGLMTCLKVALRITRRSVFA